MTDEIREKAAWLREEERKQGRALDNPDSLIAATALLWEPTDMCLVSHNAKDFRHLEVYGLRLLTIPPEDMEE